jgi:hypothetical protein
MMRMIRISKRRVAWMFAEIAMLAIIVGLVAATLLPIWIGPENPAPEFPAIRDRPRR